MINKAGKYIKRVLRGEQGAVTVEAGLYFVVFFLLCALLVDFSAFFLNKSYVERVTHSLASIVRERNLFYNGRETLSQKDVAELHQLTIQLLNGTRLAESSYQLVVEAVFFQPGSSMQKTVLNTQTFITGTGNCSARLAVDSLQVTTLSPWGADDGRWIPVYQVTLCVAGGESLFKRLLSSTGVTTGDLVVSNVVILR